MDFFYGVLTTVLFLFALLSFYYIGYKQGNKRTSKPPDQVEEDTEKKRDMQKLHNDFLKVMNYNEDVARQRKKVT